MKKMIAIAAAAAALGALALAQAAPKGGEVLTVRVLRAKVMKQPRFIGSAAATVSRGATLTFREARGQWYRVDGGASGWIHKGHVVEGKVELASTPGREGSSASQDEVELAGRGFTPQVEDEYQRRHPKLDFSHVEALEATEIDPAELEDFVAGGNLNGAASVHYSPRRPLHGQASSPLLERGQTLTSSRFLASPRMCQASICSGPTQLHFMVTR